MSCINNDQDPGDPPDFQRHLGITAPTTPDYAWTDTTYLLHGAGVSWGYYVGEGYQPDCDDDDGAMFCKHNPQTPGFDSIVNPLPRFQTVHDNHQLDNIQPASRFLQAARDGSLPAVSWVIPDEEHSEHPPS